jgi:tetratricopeptide (TPR) repeat protein
MNLKSIYYYMILHLPEKMMMQVVGKLSGQRAIDAANAVLRVFPGDECAMVVKLYALYGLGLFGDALAYSGQALAVHPRNSALRGVRANVLSHFGRTDEALVEYDNVLALHPNQPAALMHKANLLGDMGHIDIALRCYDEVVASDQSTPEDVFFAYAARGSLLVTADRTTDVENLCAELRSQYGTAPAVLSMVGTLYCQIGQVAQGRACYQQALEQASSDSAMAARIKAIVGEIEKVDASAPSVSTEGSTDCSDGGTAKIG